jgi:hypothetical protein
LLQEYWALLVQDDRDLLKQHRDAAALLAERHSLDTMISDIIQIHVGYRCLPPVFDLKNEESSARKLLQLTGRVRRGRTPLPRRARPAQSVFAKGLVNDLMRWRVQCFIEADCEGVAGDIHGAFRRFVGRAVRAAGPVVTGTDLENRFSKPKPSGYRAYHVNVVFEPGPDVRAAHPRVREVRGEIQVTTVNACAWAELQHRFVYDRPGEGPSNEWFEFFATEAKTYRNLDKRIGKSVGAKPAAALA